MKVKLFYILIILILLVKVAKPQSKVIGLEQGNPKKLKYLIEELPKETIRIGLTENRIAAKLELRCRQLGIEPHLYREYNNRGFLYININIVGHSFSTHVSYDRKVIYFVNMKKYEIWASTWWKGYTGTHVNNPENIIQSLDSILDDFFNDFLKANPR